jgi:magnesium transporter
MADSKNTCQTYKYHEESYILTKNTTAYFAKQFACNEIEKDKVVWLNFHSIEDRKDIEQLCKSLKIDQLSIEDIYEENNRPKIEEYEEYLYFSIRSALPNKTGKNLEQEQISFFLGENYLISFQEKSSDHFTSVRERIEKNKGKIRVKGPDFLLFRMLEAIIDNYFEVIEEISQRVIDLEKYCLKNTDSDTLQMIEKEKRKLVELKKIVTPLKETTSQLQKSNSKLINNKNHYVFSDLLEGCLSVLDEIESNKQLLEGITNLYFAMQGQRMNEIMKMLTIVSSIFIPLTFIAGIYGMNFQFMPELNSKYGYFFTLIIMSLISIILILYFRKKGWFK